MTFLTVCLIVNVSFAQKNSVKTDFQEIQKNSISTEKNSLNFLNFDYSSHKSNTKGTASRWYDYGYEAMYNFTSFPSGWFNPFLVWPDTNISSVYSGGVLAPPQVHSVANVLDITVDWLNGANHNGKMQYTDGASYTLDSVGIYGWYFRNNPNPSVVDTLEIEVVTDINDLMEYVYTANTWTSAFGIDTVRFAALNYDTENQKIKMPRQKFIIELTNESETDTVVNGWYSGMNYFAKAINLSVYPDVMITTYTFKPGATYSKADTIGYSDVNFMRFFGYKENPTNNPIVSAGKNNYNGSYVLWTWNKFLDPTAVNQLGRYSSQTFSLMSTPSGTTRNWDHVMVDYKITCSNCSFVGVQEQDAKNVSVYTNPANNTVTVQLANAAPAKVEIINLVGQTVISQNTSTEEVKMDVSNINRGIYMVKIAQEGKVYTSKLVVR